MTLVSHDLQEVVPLSIVFWTWYYLCVFYYHCDIVNVFDSGLCLLVWKNVLYSSFWKKKKYFFQSVIAGPLCSACHHWTMAITGPVCVQLYAQQINYWQRLTIITGGRRWLSTKQTHNTDHAHIKTLSAWLDQHHLCCYHDLSLTFCQILLSFSLKGQLAVLREGSGRGLWRNESLHQVLST